MEYKVLMHFPDGTDIEQDEIFHSEAEAEDYGCYLCSCFREGTETLHMSNPWENPPFTKEADFEILEYD